MLWTSSRTAGSAGTASTLALTGSLPPFASGATSSQMSEHLMRAVLHRGTVWCSDQGHVLRVELVIGPAKATAQKILTVSLH